MKESSSTVIGSVSEAARVLSAAGKEARLWSVRHPSRARFRAWSRNGIKGGMVTQLRARLRRELSAAMYAELKRQCDLLKAQPRQSPTLPVE